MDKRKSLTKKWQLIWKHLCDMAYYRKNISSQLLIPIHDYGSLEKMKNSNSEKFYKMTLDYTWNKISKRRDPEGNFIEPQVVPELTYMYVPRFLFEELGIYMWFKFSFPNCVIHFWEEEMRHWAVNDAV